MGEFAAKREFRQIELRGFGGGGGRQNFDISLVSCLLRGPHGAFLEVAVDKIKAFRSFFVYFRDRAISSHQRTAFHKKGSSNHCIKEKGDHPLRSTFYPVRRSHSKGPAVRFLALQANAEHKNRTSQGEVPSIIYFSSESLRQKPRMSPATIVPMTTARM